MKFFYLAVMYYIIIITNCQLCFKVSVPSPGSWCQSSSLRRWKHMKMLQMVKQSFPGEVSCLLCGHHHQLDTCLHRHQVLPGYGLRGGRYGRSETASNFGSKICNLSEAGAFWVFGGCLAVIFLFCLLFVPETKGKSLEEIQLLFRWDNIFLTSFTWCSNILLRTLYLYMLYLNV